MMNEVGNYPGQPWMWLYTFWYQVPPFPPPATPTPGVGGDGDPDLALILLPFIPGLRSIPRLIPLPADLARLLPTPERRHHNDTALGHSSRS